MHDQRPDDDQRLLDLYTTLMDLLLEGEPHKLLEESLTIARELTGARLGYLALQEPTATVPRWWVSSGFDGAELEAIHASTSNGVVAQVLESGELIQSASVMNDPRFSSRRSVRRKRIEAVLCGPICRRGGRPMGFVYLQGRAENFQFEDSHKDLLRHFTAVLANIAQVLLLGIDTGGEDPTAEYRSELDLHEILGRSSALAGVFKRVKSIAKTDRDVLIWGETGTGKNLIARAIHRNSARASGPCLEVNCAAIPENLLESELFGFRRGSHAAATRDTPGKVEACEGGTLFLDEISEMSDQAQAKLLQLLEDKRYFPLGATQPRDANVRIVAATNRPLEEAVASGHLREDVRYRFKRVISLPPLRERGGDAVVIASEACRRTAEEDELGTMSLSLAARRALREEAWPGNVRQLWSVVSSGTFAASDEGRAVVELEDLFPDREAPPSVEASESWAVQLRDSKRAILRRALDDAAWNKSEAARRLGLRRQRIHELIKQLGIEEDDPTKG